MNTAGLAPRKRDKLGKIASASSDVPGRRGQFVEIGLAEERRAPRVTGARARATSAGAAARSKSGSATTSPEPATGFAPDEDSRSRPLTR